MHDVEPDTFVYQTLPEKFCDMLKDIGIDSQPKEIDTLNLEKKDYYSRYYTNTARMVTNHGCLEVKDSNIDLVQIIQKG